MGLATPQTETVDSRSIAVVEPGTEMEIEVETDIGKTTALRGRYVSASFDVIFLEAPEGRFAIGRRWVRRITIKSGTQWVKGMLIGGGIDTSVLLVALLLASGAGH
jgi:hypothetical protein